MKYILMSISGLLPIIFCAGCCNPDCFCPDTVSTSVCQSWEKDVKECRCRDKDRCHCGKRRFETVSKDTEVCVKCEWNFR